MTIHLLPASARTPKPWKNGGGVTTDVFVWPRGAGLNDFVARVSIAEVASDGPFSVFAGIDRTTAILEGAGFDLDFADGMIHRLTAYTPPLSYSGDDAAQSRLLAGPTTDLNVMTRRGAATHRMASLVLMPGASLATNDLSLILIVSGTGNLAPAPGTFGPGDAIVLTGPQTVTMTGDAPAIAWQISFSLTPA